MSRGVGFITNYFLAKILTTDSYGLYTFALTWSGLLLIPAALGLDRLLIRNISSYKTNGEWGLLRGLLHFTTIVSTIIALILIPIVLVILQQSNIYDDITLITVLIGLMMVPFNAITMIRESALQGLKKITWGVLPNLLLKPILFLIFFLLLALISTISISPILVILTRFGAVFLTFMLAFLLLRRALPIDVSKAVPRYEIRSWMITATPMFLVTLMNYINARSGILILGSFSNNSDIALLNVALLLTSLVKIVMSAFLMPLAPTISSLFAEGKLNVIEKVSIKSTLTAFVIALPIGVILVVFGRDILNIFGTQYQSAYIALVILIVDAFVNIIFGPVGTILMMTGYERNTMIGNMFGAVTTIGGSLLLIPVYGMLGVAIAMLLSTIVWNVSLLIFVISKLKINPTLINVSKVL